MLARYHPYIDEHVEDMPEIRTWTWSSPVRHSQTSAKDNVDAAIDRPGCLVVAGGVEVTARGEADLAGAHPEALEVRRRAAATLSPEDHVVLDGPAGIGASNELRRIVDGVELHLAPVQDVLRHAERRGDSPRLLRRQRRHEPRGRADGEPAPGGAHKEKGVDVLASEDAALRSGLPTEPLGKAAVRGRLQSLRVHRLR